MSNESKRSCRFSEQIQIYVVGSASDGTVLVKLVMMLNSRYELSSGSSGMRAIGRSLTRFASSSSQVLGLSNTS